MVYRPRNTRRRLSLAGCMLLLVILGIVGFSVVSVIVLTVVGLTSGAGIPDQAPNSPSSSSSAPPSGGQWTSGG
ncbi:hypothetical protein [Brevibacterium sp. ZH18]|uniref:hypothetical protein n=1 Tax=Brevibacterium sp. ZH18 TaxID=2927784 RepID=UPI001F6219C1|nr:hypothetical protein [Brevibacterium sp. ZH18]MCI4011761.1 hypothetical protein [Brevibacterium sp. ZH18]